MRKGQIYSLSAIIFGLILIVWGYIIISQTNRKIDFENEKTSCNFQFTGYKTIYISGKNIKLYVSNTESKRTKGLSNVPCLKVNEGMIFIFPIEAKHGFWMKDMKFSLDFLWLDKNKKIIQIMKNISPETYPKVFYPIEDVKFVIELPAGSIDRFNFKTGDILQFRLNE